MGTKAVNYLLRYTVIGCALPYYNYHQASKWSALLMKKAVNIILQCSSYSVCCLDIDLSNWYTNECIVIVVLYSLHVLVVLISPVLLVAHMKSLKMDLESQPLVLCISIACNDNHCYLFHIDIKACEQLEDRFTFNSLLFNPFKCYIFMDSIWSPSFKYTYCLIQMK